MPWEYRGFRGDVPPDLLGTQNNTTALIVGGGRCVYEDLKKFDSFHVEPHDVIAVNDIGAYLTRKVAHWVSLHPAFLVYWLALRLGHNLAAGFRPVTHSNKPHAGIDVVWPMGNVGATSGFYAVAVALCMGYDRVVMAGIPADDTGRFFDQPGVNGGKAGDKHVRIAWQNEIQNKPELKQRSRSLSGWTREQLGEPDRRFFDEPV